MSGRVTTTKKAKEASTRATIADCARATNVPPTMLTATIVSRMAVVKTLFHQEAASSPMKSEVA